MGRCPLLDGGLNRSTQRLLDRLESAGLISRHRPKGDQRTVLTTLTDKGWDLVERSHQPLLKLNRSQFPHFSKAELVQFIALLQKALNRPSQTAGADKTSGGP